MKHQKGIVNNKWKSKFRATRSAYNTAHLTYREDLINNEIHLEIEDAVKYEYPTIFLQPKASFILKRVRNIF